MKSSLLMSNAVYGMNQMLRSFFTTFLCKIQIDNASISFIFSEKYFVQKCMGHEKIFIIEEQMIDTYRDTCFAPRRVKESARFHHSSVDFRQNVSCG